MANIIVSGYSQSFVNGLYTDQGDGTWRKIVAVEDDPGGFIDIFFFAPTNLWYLQGNAAYSTASGGTAESDPTALSWSNSVDLVYEVINSVDITVQPVSLTAVPGQDVTFSVTASANFSPVSYAYLWSNAATTQSITIDPLIEDDGNTYSVSVSALSGGVLQATTTSLTAVLTVIEDVVPFDVYDQGSETGRQRHLRLRLLGYI